MPALDILVLEKMPVLRSSAEWLFQRGASGDKDSIKILSRPGGACPHHTFVMWTRIFSLQGTQWPDAGKDSLRWKLR